MWIVVVLVVAYFAYAGGGNPLDGAMTLLNEITRGARLTHTPADELGVVNADPVELASSAGLTLEEYALARMIASEEPRADNVTKAAIAWATYNKANAQGTTIAALLLKAKNPLHDGYFGSQKDKDPSSQNFNGSDRYATTALDPYDGEGQIAQGVLGGTIPDLTGGASQFDRPAGEKDPDRVAQNRLNSGASLVMVAGADPGLRFWRT
jgi:hypothetical protein